MAKSLRSITLSTIKFLEKLRFSDSTSLDSSSLEPLLFLQNLFEPLNNRNISLCVLRSSYVNISIFNTYK